MVVFISVSGVTEVATVFETAMIRQKDLRPAWEEIWEKVVKRGIQSQFRTRGRRYRTPWPPLKERYLRRKLRLFPGRPLLVRTGALKRAALGGYGTALSWDEDTLTWGIKDIPIFYAKYHQFGTRKMAKRPIIGWTPRDMRDTLKILSNWVVRSFVGLKPKE